MSAAILFVALLTGSCSGLRTHRAGNDVHSMVPAAGTVCFENPIWDKMRHFVANFRAGPLTRFSPRSPAQANTSCAELGFTKVAIAEDACMKNMTVYTKQTLDVNQTLEALRAQNLREIHDYADRRNISYDTAMAWTVCNGGCTDNIDKKEGFRWWGADRWVDGRECGALNQGGGLLRLLEVATPKIGAFVPDSGVACWEGHFDYMEKTLAKVKRTPAGDLFKDATVKATTCNELGYGLTRDPRDECWTEATKCMRRDTNDQDMGNWVFGPASLHTNMPLSDKARGYPEGTSLDLFSCQCERPGVARERAMWITMDGSASNARYTDEFCNDLNKRYLGN